MEEQLKYRRLQDFLLQFGCFYSNIFINVFRSNKLCNKFTQPKLLLGILLCSWERNRTEQLFVVKILTAQVEIQSITDYSLSFQIHTSINIQVLYFYDCLIFFLRNNILIFFSSLNIIEGYKFLCIYFTGHLWWF